MSRSVIFPASVALISGGLLALAFPGTGEQSWLAFGALTPLLDPEYIKSDGGRNGEKN